MCLKRWLAIMLATTLIMCNAFPAYAGEHNSEEVCLDAVLTAEAEAGEVREEVNEPEAPAPPAATEAPAPTEPVAPAETNPAPSEENPGNGEEIPENNESSEDIPAASDPTDESSLTEETTSAEEPTRPSNQKYDDYDGIRDYSSRVSDSSDAAARLQRFSEKDLTMEIPILMSGNGHFVTVDKVPATVHSEVYVKESMSNRAMNVGHLLAGDLVYILEEPNHPDGRETDWYYIESGEVRGFVLREDVLLGSEMSVKDVTKVRTAETAVALKAYHENHAYTYSMKTTKQTMSDRVYALTTGKAEIMSSMQESAEVVGRLKKNSLCYIIETVDADWLYVESGESRGFILADKVNSGSEITDKVMKKGEAAFLVADTLIDKNQNEAYCYSMSSPIPGIITGDKKSSLYENLNDYEDSDQVPGVKENGRIEMTRVIGSLFRAYGYNCGDDLQAIEKAGRIHSDHTDLQTGDIIIYRNKAADEAENQLCGIYLKNEKVLIANKNCSALKTSSVKKLEISKVIRILEDYQTQMVGAGIAEVNAEAEMYGENLGVFKLTFYCACRRCNGPFSNAITSTGKTAEEGRTIAVDPRIIPYGTKVIIGGHVFTAEDCGGAIKGNRIDVFVNNHAVGDALGVQYANVFLCK